MQDLINKIDAWQARLDKVLPLVEVERKKSRAADLQAEMARPGFWNNQEKAKNIGREASDLLFEVGEWESVQRELTDLREVAVMDRDDQTVSLREEVEIGLSKWENQFSHLELTLLFKGKYDRNDAIVAIHSGAGGTDAQDWAEMLLRMYLRFCEKQGWKTNIITISEGGEAGIKSVLFEVSGLYAYGQLKAEAGVHRLVRISPFDAEKMRHTSFALVEALPMLDDKVEITIKPDELRIDTYRAGGHGGQNVNKTDSAVRITHLPTNIVVTCQNERSQLQNKEKAMKVLMAKLQQYYETEVEEERQKLRGEYTEAAWGNQARSYVIHPYKMVKDHRTELETSDVEGVLDGDLAPFIEAYLRQG